MSDTWHTDSAKAVSTDGTPTFANGDNRPNNSSSAPVVNMTRPSSNKAATARAGSTISHEKNVDPQSGRTIWPEVHKRKLATAARTALMSAPANAGRQLSADEIHEILDHNPSYMGLCETLEAKGFIIERASFARTLLAAVPDLGSAQDQARNETPRLQMQTSLQPSTPPSSYSSVTKPPTLGMLVSTKAPNVPLTEAQPAVPSVNLDNHNVQWADQRNITRTFSHPQSPLHSPQKPQQSLIPPPAPPKPSTKEEMARKRNFNDIVDLTQALSDEDDFQPSPKIARIESPQTDSSALTIAASASKNVETPVSSLSSRNKSPKTTVVDLEPNESSTATKKKNADLSQYKYAPLPIPSKQEPLRFANVVRSMNRNDALRRSSYNPKTICRDILVSSGKHPTMAPLNYHLEILRKTFHSIDNHSDLSTFRWDLVDPGGDPVPSISQFKSIDDVEMHDADDEGVQPTISPVAQPAMARRGGRIAVASLVNGEEVATSDVHDPLPIKGRLSLRGQKRRQGRVFGTQSRPIDVDASEGYPFGVSDPSSSGTRRSDDQDLSKQRAGAGASTTYVHIRTDEADVGRVNPTGEISSPHRRRRPPGKKSFSTPVRNTVGISSPSDTGSGLGSKQRGRPPGSKDKSLRKNAAILRATDTSIRTLPGSSATNTTPARPSGLRHTMTPSDGIAVLIESPKQTDSGERKRRSKSQEPRKQKKATPSGRHPSSPNHEIYKCQWNGCQSKLHNLETLRKHVRMHRDGYPIGPFPCLWADCGPSKVSKGEPKAESELQWLEFGTRTVWEKHMESKHLDRYAWELGDGPSTHPSGKPPFQTRTLKSAH